MRERTSAIMAILCRCFMAGTAGMILVVYLDRRLGGHYGEAAAAWRDLCFTLKIWGACEAADLAFEGMRARIRRIYSGETSR